jgi:hypothetical protein
MATSFSVSSQDAVGAHGWGKRYTRDPREEYKEGELAQTSKTREYVTRYISPSGW